MRRLSVLLIASCITAAISCKKETVTTATNESTPNAASMQSTTSDQAVSSGTQFGGGGFDGLTTDQKITVYNKLGIQPVRAHVTLKDFDGGVSGLKKFTSQGFKVILNINWSSVPKKGGDKVSTAWPQDMNLYKQKLAQFFEKYYKPDIAVIENEPAIDIFHKGPIEDYITELTNAVQVCKQYGVKVADGSIHVPYVLTVMRGGNLTGNALEVKKLIAAYKTLDLDYVNIHAHGSGDSYPSGDLEKVASYIRQQTGKPVMSNEFTLGKSSTSLLQDMVNGFKQGDYKIALIRSDNGDRSVGLTKGTDLLPLGNNYRDMIK